MLKIWTFSEKRDYMLELICAAKELTDFKGYVVSFALDEEAAAIYSSYGADKVYILPKLAEEQPMESYVPLLGELSSEEKPDIFLLTSTLRGNEIAARLAARLDVGLGTNCTNLKLDDQGNLSMEKMIFGGAGIKTSVCTQKPQMAAILPKVFQVKKVPTAGSAVIEHLDKTPTTLLKIVSRKKAEKSQVDLTASKAIVCAGRGLEKEEDLELVRSLAEALQGEIACTRPIAEEMHWLPEERYIGISGKKVRPDLYFGVGVSGQIQHISGMRDAKVVVAVNKDENAPIFDECDYGIVGDLYDILPLFQQEIKQIKK
jgi:electron transfer flavoprotein alpha subunit